MKWLKTRNESKTDVLVKNARKFDLDDFVEEWVGLHFIKLTTPNSTQWIPGTIKKGDSVVIRTTKGDITSVADKDYSDTSHWSFIMNNTKDLQEEAKQVWMKNKDAKKPKFTSKSIKGYHVSPNKFKTFRYNQKNNSGGLKSESIGFFFFENKEDAKSYLNTTIHYDKKAYLYEVDIQVKKLKEFRGEDIGTNWNRFDELLMAENEGYNVVRIIDADTGYGIVNELVVFDDDDIRINNIETHENILERKDNYYIEFAQDFLDRVYKGEPWGHHSYEDIEDRVLDFAKSDFPYGLQNIPNPLILYRMLNVSSVDDINRSALGKHYVGDKSMFDDEEFLYSASILGGNKKVERLLIVTVETTPDNLDIEDMLGIRAEYPEEYEYTLKNDNDLKILDIEEYRRI